MKIVGFKALAKHTGISRTQLHERIAAGLWPAGKMEAGFKVWESADIEQAVFEEKNAKNMAFSRATNRGRPAFIAPLSYPQGKSPYGAMVCL